MSRPFEHACLHVEDIEVHRVEHLSEGALAALSLLLELPAEQVSKVLDHFCKGCGGGNPYCPCAVCSGCRRDKPYCCCLCPGCGAVLKDCFCEKLGRKP